MLRLVIAGLLATLGGACSHHEDAAVADPGGPAGNVVEVTGTVTATGATGTRTLKPGDTVAADDAIDTGTGTVAIVLVHNAARWELGPDHHNAKVRESAAWKLARQDGVAKPVDVQTTPAGREAEHTAVDTVATTTSSKTEAKAAAPAAAQTPPPIMQPVRPRETSGSPGGGTAGSSDKGDATGKANNGVVVGSAHDAPNLRGHVTADRELRVCLTKQAHLVIACATSTCKVTGSDITAPVRACLVGRLNSMMLGDLSLTVDLAPPDL